MKTLNTYINEWKLTNDSDIETYIYFPKTFNELWDIIYQLYIKNPKSLNLRCIDISNVNKLSGTQSIKRLGKNIQFYGLFADFDKVEMIDITGWDTSKFENMEYMFYNCNSLKEIRGLDTIDTSKLKCMDYMFYKCENIINIPLFNTQSIEDMNYTFIGCDSLNTTTRRKWSKIYNFNTNRKNK